MDITEEQQKIMNLFLNDESVQLSTIEKEFSDLPTQKVRYFLDGLEKKIFLIYFEKQVVGTNADKSFQLQKAGRTFLFDREKNDDSK